MGQFSFRRYNVNRARVRELIRRGVEAVTKTDSVSHTMNVFLITGQKMPSSSCVCTFRFGQVVDVQILLCSCERGSLARIETDAHDVEILAGFQRQRFERSDHTVQNL